MDDEKCTTVTKTTGFLGFTPIFKGPRISKYFRINRHQLVVVSHWKISTVQTQKGERWNLWNLNMILAILLATYFWDGKVTTLSMVVNVTNPTLGDKEVTLNYLAYIFSKVNHTWFKRSFKESFWAFHLHVHYFPHFQNSVHLLYINLYPCEQLSKPT